MRDLFSVRILLICGTSHTYPDHHVGQPALHAQANELQRSSAMGVCFVEFPYY
ncbi:hypothetical protein K440DRAFT_609837 [Wilcoxina mikolae CBS 423.85]|nr:hypothetical protein K440DRAFT_609837 [Wilcoxina mikolae CBS 423.85]